MGTAQEIKELTESVLVHAYGDRPLTLVRGEGVYLYDADGKSYLDFAAGIAVCALGYGNERFTGRLGEQIHKVLHVSNLFYNEWAGKAGKYLAEASGMDRVFFTNSGAEAIEGALKLARKAYYLRTGKQGGRILAMEHSFHGRTMGALSVTGQKKYQEAFEPLVGGVEYAVFNDLESVKRLMGEDVCAVILETVQGEGGIYPATQEFLSGVRALCDEYGALLILDEIQCGMGRCGTMFAYQGYGIKPDIMASAKALGCGVPVGAFAATEAAAQAFVPGDHGTTYGGNPFACAAVCAVFEEFEEMGLAAHAGAMGTVLERGLSQLAAEKKTVAAHRGKGLMQGLELSVPAAPVLARARDKGVILISAGANVIRFVPPLVVTEKEIARMLSVLGECLE